MAERKRSQDDSRDSDKSPRTTGPVSQRRREGGRQGREIGTRDALKRRRERPAGPRDVEKSGAKDSDR